MKRLLLSFASCLLLVIAQAQHVSVSDAQRAAANYLAAVQPSHDIRQMTLYHTIIGQSGDPIIYIFNVDNDGFVAFGADLSYDPLVGYSFGGNYDTLNAPCNLKAWLNAYASDVDAMKSAAPKDDATLTFHKGCKDSWKKLLAGDTRSLADKSKSSVGPLVETKWDQGGGYNNYCPVYSPGPNGHSYTGCVATAMAQIIRYHRYPTTGFSRSSYYHSYHGYQYAAYDSVTFDYTKMPTSVSTYSLASSQHNVSLLCYYCGVSVRMNYLNPGHTTGSGAYSTDVPNGLKYFGYANSYHMSKPTNLQLWDSLLRNELDNGRPVYYSGSNNDGGHAFVCDGYNTNGTYSFNFGWSGSGDGFFTISYVGGFSTGQAAVFNIIPSRFSPLGDTIYIAADGNGGGSSWEDANPNLHDAIRLAKLCSKKNIWVKNGTYKGNVTSPYAFEMESSVNIHGGFDGTESSLDDRSGDGKTILSGDGRRIALYASSDITNASIYDVTIADGYATNGAGVTLNSGLRMERCTIENNTATNGAALLDNGATVYNCIIHNNRGGGASLNFNSSLRNCLVAHNDGYGIQLSNSGIDGCDIVCNRGTGIVNDTNNTKRVRNSVVWNNSSQLAIDDTRNIFFCAIEGLEAPDSNSNFGLSHENRPAGEAGPFFMDPDITVGRSENLGDWRISSLSPLVDAGDTVRSGAYIRDLDDNNRFLNGRTDIGCYEWIPGNAVTEAMASPLVIYPNPATTSITIEGQQGTVEIYDIMGRRLLSATCSSPRKTIDITELPKGIYLLRTATSTTKLLKK